MISFFGGTLEEMVGERSLPQVATLRSEMGEHPVFQAEVDGVPLGLFASGPTGTTPSAPS